MILEKLKKSQIFEWSNLKNQYDPKNKNRTIYESSRKDVIEGWNSWAAAGKEEQSKKNKNLNGWEAENWNKSRGAEVLKV